MYVTRRERQRQALRISAEDIAAELGITLAELVVLESRADTTHEAAGGAWDAALARIVRARRDAAKDGATSDDTLLQWKGSPKRAHTARTVADTGSTDPIPATRRAQTK